MKGLGVGEIEEGIGRIYGRYKKKSRKVQKKIKVLRYFRASNVIKCSI